MNRLTAAFVISPLWVPLIVFPVARLYFFPHPGQHIWVMVSGILSAIFSYLGVVLFGLPIFRFLKSRGWTTLWIAGATGFVVGAITWIVFTAFFAFSLGEGLTGFVMQDWRETITFLWMPGALGMLVGLTFWGIARPDRP